MWTNEYKPDDIGFQVLLSVYNGENYVQRCLESLDNSLKGYNWVLLYGDDASTDSSTVELAKYARNFTCDKAHLYEYDKALTVGEAKNRLIKEAHSFKKEYPYILFMDVDDIMLPERPKMVKTAMETNSEYVVGSWERVRYSGQRQFKDSKEVSESLKYGPWATLFHCDFLPKDGAFFPEDEVSNNGHEDLLTWYHLRYIKGLKATPHLSENPVHSYIQNIGSASNHKNTKKTNYRRNIFWGISRLIKDDKRNIYEKQLSPEEAEAAMEDYILFKQIEKAELQSVSPFE